ncbi:MAG: spore coat protein CotJB [Clostridia bacterium]|nr:spore coat protein CotJB [Clostridia bacterium]
MSREDLLQEIMEYAFVEKELNLFLDTNPTDKKALAMHKSVAEKLEDLVEEYEDDYGPLRSENNMNSERWAWMDGPWPWEKD